MVLASAGDDLPLDKLAALTDKIYEVTATPPQTSLTFSPPPVCKVTASDQLVTELSHLRDEVSSYFPCKMDHATHADALHLLFHGSLVMSIKLFAGIIRNFVHPQGSANHHAHTLYLSCTHYHATGKLSGQSLMATGVSGLSQSRLRL